MSELSCVKSVGSKTAIIRCAFIKICTDTTFQRRLWNRWLPAATWVEALTLSNHIDQTLMSSISVGAFNAAMGKSKGDFDGQMMSRYDGTNTTGIFQVRFQQTMYYIVTDKGKQIPYPQLDKKWKEGVLAVAKNVFNIPSTRSSSNDRVLPDESRNKRQRTADVDPDPLAIDANHMESHELVPRPVQVLLPAPADMNYGDAGTAAPASTHHNDTRQGLLALSYWNSQDASNLFGVKLEETALGDVRDVLKVRVKLLQSVSSREDGWRNVVDGRDPDNLCSTSDIFAVRGRSIILCLAYQLAIINMTKWTWIECCSEACSQLNQLGIVQATHNRAVRDWNIIFRQHSTFPHPNYFVRCGKKPLPLLFEKYPAAMDDISRFGVQNLTTLTVESMQGFCHDTLIPKLLKQWRSDHEESQSTSSSTTTNQESTLTKQLFMEEHNLSSLSIPTCWRWMHRLGFKHCEQRKGYYVDGHERSDVKESRKIFCEIYLMDIEPRCLRWIHVSQRELETTHNVLHAEFGYRYLNDTGEVYVEFHIDYVASQNNEDVDLLLDRDPKMSVRAPVNSKPVEIFGQDESVFSQFMFPTKSWVGPNQERGLFPKSLGEGLMISAFVSRDSGFGMSLTVEQLNEVNIMRQGQDYIDKVAATQINSTAAKPPLKETPFVRSLLIGATKGGYWNSFHMALQLEDVVDCLKIVRPGFDFVFLFDHSQGHARKKDGALDTSSMSRSFGGVQAPMRSSKIVDGCLGPYNSTLSIGDIQSMVFDDNHDGPWWITTAEGREARRYDVLHASPDGVAPKLANRTKQQLANALRDEAGITVDPLRPMSEIKEYAERHGINLQYEKTRVTEGWQGKPKGLLQILWERGWIDPCKCTTFRNDKTAGRIVNTSFYTINGRKDMQTGQLVESSSLRVLMGQCTDFQEEETALQHLGSQLGLRVLFTPKFHCEFAGEGIEYNWAHAKAKMRTTPIREKKGRANFIELVKKCICPENVLTKERIRKFSARARAYICAYYHLSREEDHVAGDPGAPVVGFVEKQQLLFKEIERLMKKFKTHRCVLDFDSGFVKGTLIDLT
jgi:hypothetical protein